MFRLSKNVFGNAHFALTIMSRSKHYVNLLKTKRNLLYIRNQSLPRSKLFPITVIKANKLMMY